MRTAARAWQEACNSCGIFFEEVEIGSSGPRPSFIVQQHDAGGSYIAAAFFPHYAQTRRVLRIDPSYFLTTFDRVGVLRHELGHVLGYRHEHIRDVIGCAREERGWQPLTPYDPHSVMHYMCGGGGGLALALTELDIVGHRQLYGEAPAPARTTSFQEPNQRTATEQTLRSGIANPFDNARLDAVVKLLPSVGEYFVVEGDLKMTRQEVIAYLAARGDAEAPLTVTPELLINLHRGAPDYYQSPEARRLTYRVDRGSFSDAGEYQAVVDDMVAATRDWENACADCRIRFVAVAGGNVTPNFTVRRLDAAGAYVAAAFFPHDAPARRFVDIDPSYFKTSFNRIGVLRHELGHVLGYRHEHIRGVPGCYREGNEWRPLTPYDPKSVMHYVCGSNGTRELALTETDRAGHTRLYTISAASANASAATLVVALEGGNVADSAARVLMLLNEMAILPVSSRRVGQGETVSTIYRGALGVPGYATTMTALASELNGRDVERRPLAVDEVLRYPDVRFRPYEFDLLLKSKDDEQKIKEIEKNWGDIAVQKPMGGKQIARYSDNTYFEVTGYELRIVVPNVQRAKDAEAKINQLNSKNIVATVETRATAAKYFAFELSDTTKRPMGQFLGLVDAQKHIAPANEEGSIVSLLGPTTLAGARACADDCPKVVLFDGRPSVHPDLKGAVEGDVDRSAENLSLIDGTNQTFQLEPEFKKEYHSTHLAGIIAARENGFGIIGVDPQAMVVWQDWDTLRTKLKTASDEVRRRQNLARGNGSLQIYLFATSWESAHTTRESRNNDDILARRLTSLAYKPLIVAAAGQVAAGAVGQRVTEATPEAPMSMGMEDFILVVTACDPCTGATRALVREANHSKLLVHVAAPGVGVVSTVHGGRYTKHGGTSQAAAFVAGLASAMASRYPNAYADATALKLRLQVTSMPAEFFGVRSVEMAAGIVDPDLATRNPTISWVKYNGANWEQVTSFKWLRQAIAVDDGLSTDSQGVSAVLRIIKRNNQWIFYREEGVAGITKRGPVTVSATDLDEQIAEIDGARKTLGEIEDLILTYAEPAPTVL